MPESSLEELAAVVRSRKPTVRRQRSAVMALLIPVTVAAIAVGAGYWTYSRGTSGSRSFSLSNALSSEFPKPLKDLNIFTTNHDGMSITLDVTNEGSDPITIYAARYNGDFVPVNCGSDHLYCNTPMRLTVGETGGFCYQHVVNRRPGMHYDKELVWVDIWTDRGAFRWRDQFSARELINDPCPAVPAPPIAGK